MNKIGAPQGTILGPILWNVFTDALLPDIPHIKYPDDTALLYYPVSKNDCIIKQSTTHLVHLKIPVNSILHNAINNTVNRSSNNKINFNVNQSYVMTLSSQQKLTALTHLLLYITLRFRKKKYVSCFT